MYAHLRATSFGCLGVIPTVGFGAASSRQRMSLRARKGQFAAGGSSRWPECRRRSTLALLA